MNLSVVDVFHPIAIIILTNLLSFTSGLNLTLKFLCHDGMTRSL